MMQESVQKVREKDPAAGRWNVDDGEATVWTDASSLALGVVVIVDSQAVEDACWLRSDDSSHINMAELDALTKGLNMAITWDMRTVHLRTDSLTVYRWVSDALSEKCRLKTKASGEMLIRRRVGIIKGFGGGILFASGCFFCSFGSECGGCPYTSSTEMAFIGCGCRRCYGGLWGGG